jgi:hypothetical protein
LLIIVSRSWLFKFIIFVKYTTIEFIYQVKNVVSFAIKHITKNNEFEQKIKNIYKESKTESLVLKLIKLILKWSLCLWLIFYLLYFIL